MHKEVRKKIHQTHKQIKSPKKPLQNPKGFSFLCHLFHVYQSTLVTVVYLEKWSESLGYMCNHFGEKESMTAKMRSERREAASVFAWGFSKWRKLCCST